MKRRTAKKRASALTARMERRWKCRRGWHGWWSLQGQSAFALIKGPSFILLESGGPYIEISMVV